MEVCVEIRGNLDRTAIATVVTSDISADGKHEMVVHSQIYVQFLVTSSLLSDITE